MTRRKESINQSELIAVLLSIDHVSIYPEIDLRSEHVSDC